MRISDRHRYDITGTRIETAKSDNAKMLETLSTQKRINRVSDDPVSMVQVIRHKDRLGRLRQFQKNAEYSKGYIETTETAISGIHDALIRAKELSVAMASSTYGPDSREAAAREINEIVNAVVNLGNTTYGSKFVFGGFRTQTPPIAADGHYVGDDGAIFMQLDEDFYQQVNLQARYLFEAGPEEQEKGHFNLIDTLTILQDGLHSDDIETVRKAMDELDQQLKKASSFQATLGAIHNAIGNASKKLELGEELTTENMSKLEDADIYKASSDFKRTETVLQSSLMASNKLLQPSLLNFLQ